MNFKSESEFTRWFSKQVTAAGAEVVAFVGSRLQQGGICDRYVCHPTFRGWLEMKRGGERLRSLQKVFMNRLLSKGDVAMVVRYHVSNTIEIEDTRGHQLGWLNLRPLYVMKPTDAGQRLLWTLSEAWQIFKK